MQINKTGDFGWIAGRTPLDPDKPTLVFIHGAGGSSAMWSGQVSGLTEVANTVALDLPGHGASEPPGLESAPEYAAKVAEFMELIEAPSPVPAGLSMGGAVTQQLLLDFPERFDRAVLISTGARLKVLPAIFETIERDFGAYIDLMGKFSVSDKTDPELVRPVLEDTALREPKVVSGDFRACDAFDVMDRLYEVRARVLVITASDDKLTPWKYGEFLAERIPRAGRVHIKDAGHLVPVEKPEETNRAIRNFLMETADESQG